jgi:putative ABC transport system permease protein
MPVDHELPEDGGQVRRMIRQESVITALIGAAVGLPLGFQVQLVVSTIVAVIAGVLAAIVPARRAGKLNVLRALQHE